MFQALSACDGFPGARRSAGEAGRRTLMGTRYLCRALDRRSVAAATLRRQRPPTCVVGVARTAGGSAVRPESATSQMTRAAPIFWPLPL